MDGNQLAQLPDSLSTLASLRSLFAAGNRLRELPDIFAYLHHLEVRFRQRLGVAASPSDEPVRGHPQGVLDISTHLNSAWRFIAVTTNCTGTIA